MKRLRCRVCEKPIPPVALAHGDPYCSSTCCRTANGVPLPESEYARRTRKK